MERSLPQRVKEEFAIAFGAGDGGVDDVDACAMEFLNARSDAIDGELVRCGIADDAAFSDVLAAGFELRLDEDDSFKGMRRTLLRG
jgi:hypothetical protein